jgi:hypothetical protein
MKKPLLRLSGLVTLALLAGLAAGCYPESAPEPPPEKPAPPPPADTTKPPPARKQEIAKNIVLEIQGNRRRVFVEGSVCLQRGMLELLLTREKTKEHEAVISADIDAHKLHFALILAGAKEGSPVKFQPKYTPATGQTIKITVEYMEKGQKKSVDGKEWVRNAANKQTLAHDWVFAGSRLVRNPLDPNKLIYLANDGDLVCVCNFDSALLDLPIKSSKDAADLVWETNTEKIPEVGTKVTVILEPVPEKKK